MARAPRGGSWSAEYRARIERAQARGLTHSQARGHPAKGEVHASVQRQLSADLASDLKAHSPGDLIHVFNYTEAGGREVIVVVANGHTHVTENTAPNRKAIDLAVADLELEIY